MKKKETKRTGQFEKGRAGCEARLYRVKGVKPLMAEPDEETPERMVAGDSVREVLDYMERWEDGFDIKSIKCLGIIVLLSGTPYH